MKLQHLANQRVIISRMMPVGGSTSRLALSTVTAAFGHLQPLAAEKVSLVNGVYGKTFAIWVDFDVDLKELDQLRDEDGNIYTVRKGGVTRWKHGAMDFQEVLLTRS